MAQTDTANSKLDMKEDLALKSTIGQHAIIDQAFNV